MRMAETMKTFDCDCNGGQPDLMRTSFMEMLESCRRKLVNLILPKQIPYGLLRQIQ